MRRRARSCFPASPLASASAAALALAAGAARAEEPAAEERPSYWVDFEAGKVVVDPEDNVLELQQGVAIKVHRYRLTSDRLVLTRGPRGIVVDGDGRVAFCPCPDPPVTLGFSAATVAPPTDLIIEDPTLRIGDVPVFWLPYLWLRAPDRLGLLPPRFAWRGDDGLLAGSGVHVPLGDLDAAGEADALDLHASGYLQGGVELDARMVAGTTSTRARFDHLRQSLLAVDARGVVSGPSGAAVAWRMDAIRGERGRRGTLLLEEAARRWDRAEASALGSEGPLVFGFGARTRAPRGGDFDDPGSGGPAAHAGAGTAIGEVGTLDMWLAAHSLDDRARGSSSVAEQRAELELDARPGPLGAELTLAEGALVDSRTDETGALGWLAARARMALPLERRFGDRDPLVHRIEPFVRGGARATAERGVLVLAEPLDVLDTASASGGIRTALGRYGARSGATLELEAGTAGPTTSLAPALAARALADAPLFGVGSGVGWTPTGERAVATTARVRFGRVDSLHLGASADGRTGAASPRAFLLDQDFDAPRVAPFDRDGWSVASELGVPVSNAFATALGADYDVSGDELLGVRGSVGYRHACGCLAALAWAGHRLGREGVDAWVTVDLLP